MTILQTQINNLDNVDPAAVATETDRSLFMTRTEVMCAACGDGRHSGIFCDCATGGASSMAERCSGASSPVGESE